MTPEQKAARLTKAQREALIAAIDCLDSIAGEGIFVSGKPEADIVLHDLFAAFAPDWPGDAEYTGAVRAILKEQANEG